MTSYLMLLPALFFLTISSSLAYDSSRRDRPWHIPAIVSISLIMGVLWGVASKYSTSNRHLYSVSALWDVVAIIAFNIMPLIFYNVRLNLQSWIGVAFVVSGATIIAIYKR